MANKLYELVFRLLYRGFAVHSLGTWLGLRGLWSLAPMYLLILGLTLWCLGRSGRRPWLTTTLAVVIGVAILVSYRGFPLTGPYADRAYAWITAIWEPK